MKEIIFTPDAAEKLRQTKQYIIQQFGSSKAREILSSIMEAIRGLQVNERRGIAASIMFEVETDYRYLFVAKNYVFYRVEDKYIRIIGIYHEREDFMWQLFGICTTSNETLNYWSEDDQSYFYSNH